MKFNACHVIYIGRFNGVSEQPQVNLLDPISDARFILAIFCRAQPLKAMLLFCSALGGAIQVVLAMGYKAKICQPIVRPIPIDVVNNLMPLGPNNYSM